MVEAPSPPMPTPFDESIEGANKGEVGVGEALKEWDEEEEEEEEKVE